MPRLSLSRLCAEAWPTFREEHARLFEGAPKGRQLDSRLNAAFLAGCAAGEAMYDDLLKGQSKLIATAPELLESVKELRTAYSACMRVINTLGGNDLLVEEFKKENIQSGVLVRAVDVIVKAEG